MSLLNHFYSILEYYLELFQKYKSLSGFFIKILDSDDIRILAFFLFVYHKLSLENFITSSRTFTSWNDRVESFVNWGDFSKKGQGSFRTFVFQTKYKIGCFWGQTKQLYPIVHNSIFYRWHGKEHFSECFNLFSISTIIYIARFQSIITYHLVRSTRNLIDFVMCWIIVRQNILEFNHFATFFVRTHNQTFGTFNLMASNSSGSKTFHAKLTFELQSLQLQ